MYQPFDKTTASAEDRVAWALCQIIDDDAPMRWTRYRAAAVCIARNPEVMGDLRAMLPVPGAQGAVDGVSTILIIDVLNDALKFVDIYRKQSLGDGDITAMNIRHLVRQLGA